MKTIDGGVVWKKETVGSNGNNIYAMGFKNQTSAVLVGAASNVTALTDQADLYSGRFWYDKLGRQVLSQNTRQFNKYTGGTNPLYSYTRHDHLGRVNEVGELEASITPNVTNING